MGGKGYSSMLKKTRPRTKQQRGPAQMSDLEKGRFLTRTSRLSLSRSTDDTPSPKARPRTLTAGSCPAYLTRSLQQPPPDTRHGLCVDISRATVGSESSSRRAPKEHERNKVVVVAQSPRRNQAHGDAAQESGWGCYSFSKDPPNCSTC